MKNKRIVFMGTPDFASCSLKKLIDNGYNVIAVFCQPDKPVGRKQIITQCPVKQVAVENNIPVFQPDKLRNDEVTELIKDLNPDIIIVVAYGKIIPEAILEIPKMGCINVHGSILPKYRGAAPIQWSVLNGDEITGVTTMYMDKDMDTGDIIYIERTPIGLYETAGELFDRLSEIGANLLIKTIKDINDGSAPRIKQDSSQATYVTMMDKSICPVDFNQPAKKIINHIHGLNPWPVATAKLGHNDVKVFKAEYSDIKNTKNPGDIIAVNDRGIVVGCKDDETVVITEVQLPGKNRMSAIDYARGQKLDR